MTEPGRRRNEKNEEIDQERGVFMISVAAELAGMHPQTLRMYEARGLITPKRSPKKTRLYSQRDVELLRRIQRMTGEEGLNLAGVETVLEMERQVERMRSEMSRMRRRAREMERKMVEDLERARRAMRADIVPYGAYRTELVPDSEGDGRGTSEESVQIPVERDEEEED